MKIFSEETGKEVEADNEAKVELHKIVGKSGTRFLVEVRKGNNFLKKDISEKIEKKTNWLFQYFMWRDDFKNLYIYIFLTKMNELPKL